MFKNIFKTTISLVTKPSAAWKELSGKKDDDSEQFLSGYVYPYTGMIALAAFVGILLTHKDFELQVALKSAILAFLSYLGAFWLAAYLLDEALRGFFGREKNIKLCRYFVGYSLTLMFALKIIQCLLPEDFFFIPYLAIYTAYIVWEGAIPYMEISEKEQMRFTGIASVIIILTPYAIEYFIKLLMPGLRLV